MLRIEHLTKIYGGKRPWMIFRYISVRERSMALSATMAPVKPRPSNPAVVSCSLKKGRSMWMACPSREDPIGCKRKIAYLPDNPDLYEFLSGVQYLNFIADVYGVPKEEREQRIKEYADLFGLTEDLAQPISAYSHGMKQKLAIISALIHSPKLLIMDEPFVGLDPKAAMSLSRSCGGCAIAVRPFSSPPMCWR